MEFADFVAEALARNRRATLNLVKDLTPEQLRWQPAPGTNPIGFLLWHIARTEDSYFHRSVTQEGDVWDREKWYEKFRLPPKETGNTWTAEQVAAFVSPPLTALLGYMEAVRKSVLAIVKGINTHRLEERPRPDRPQMRLADYLISAITHEAEHRGDIGYVLGLMKSKQP